MTADNEIPTEQLSVPHTSSGFLPDIALHQRGEKWHHESSYSHFWFFGIMCVLGLAACFIPWDARTFFNFPVRYFVAASFLWGGICGLIPFYIRNRIGQHIVVDTTAKTVTIDQRDTSNILPTAFTNPTSILSADPPAQPTRIISFSDVLGIQIIGKGPYQANIVFRDGDAITRHNLINHGAKPFPKAIANAYCLAGGVPAYGSHVVLRRTTWLLRRSLEQRFSCNVRSLRCRVLACHLADTASLATRLSFGKQRRVTTLVDFGGKRSRKNLRLGDSTISS